MHYHTKHRLSCLGLSAVFLLISVRQFLINGFSVQSIGWQVFLLGLAGTSFFLAFLIKPLEKLKKLSEKEEKKTLIIVIVVIIFVSCLSMGLSPRWNGEIPGHRNQYEIMADSLINGHLYMDYDDVDPKLETLDNPYDPVERMEKGVEIHWDHAYYQGHYYMYFGIVPVIFVFIPFKLLTGNALTTYHATQLFTAIFILGFILFLKRLKKQFFHKLSFPVFLVLIITFSLLSTWLIACLPSLYCTAIAAGICCEIWSLFFFTKAVWIEKTENKQILWALIGSFFGALAFGCRPPVALANLLLIPFLIEYFRQKLEKKAIRVKLILKLMIAALPYLIIGALLMIYNYARFDNIFEFGQSYQLTVADQHLYGSFLVNFNLKTTLQFLYDCFLMINGKYLGTFLQFPVLLTGFLIFEKKTRAVLSRSHFNLYALSTGIVILLIVVFQSLTSPVFCERYKMDILWLYSLLSFFGISGMLCSQKGKSLAVSENTVVTLAIFAIIVSFILFFVPNDCNFTDYYWPQIINTMKGMIGKVL